MTGIALGLALLAGGYWGWVAVAGIGCLASSVMLALARPIPWLGLALALAVLGAARVAPGGARPVPDWVGGEAELTGLVVSSPVDNGNRQQFVLLTRPDDGTSPSAVRIFVTAPVVPRLGWGDQIAISGSVRRIDQLDAQTAGYLRYRECVGDVTVERVDVLARGHGPRAASDRVRRTVTDALRAAAPGDRGSLMAGLVTGDDAALSDKQRQAFIVTGTSHVTAVSGSNFSLLVTMVVFLSGWLGSARAPWRIVLVGGAIWSYVGLVGGSPPAMRAAIVASLALAARAAGRKPDFVTLAVIAAAAEVAVRPQDARSLAFQLSTVSALALVLSLGGRSPNGARGWLTHGIVATAVTQAATSALLVPRFDRFPVYAIPTNLLIGPLCTAAFPLSLVAGLGNAVHRGLGDPFALAASAFGAMVLAVVRGFAALPYANAGQAMIETVPVYWWPMIGVAAVTAVSDESRGGIARALSRARSLTGRERAVAIGTVAGGFGGWLLATIMR